MPKSCHGRRHSFKATPRMSCSTWRLPSGSACLTLFEALGPWLERGRHVAAGGEFGFMRLEQQDPIRKELCRLHVGA